MKLFYTNGIVTIENLYHFDLFLLDGKLIYRYFNNLVESEKYRCNACKLLN